MRCNQCHVTLHYCPCCGAAAFTSERGPSSTKGKGHSRTASTAAPASSSAAGASAGKANSGGEAWASRLPRRPISAYEVYQAEQLELHERGRHTAGAAGLPTADVPTATTNNTGRTPPSSPEEQRAIAVAWLRLDATAKQRYEAAALQWASGLGDVGVRKTTATAPNPAPSSLITPSPAAVIPAVELPVWRASAGATSATEGPVTTPRPPLTPPSAKASAKKSTPKKATQSSVAVSSFSLFRAAMKKRKWSIAQTTLSWERMTVEEKSRYDAAAAAYRTENFLPAAAGGTATTATATAPATSV